MKLWHGVTITVDGPQADEEDDPNPFLDFRMDVTFTQGGTTVTVPGYFAADGNAAETSATNGNKWRAHFLPRNTGEWQFSVSLRTGDDVATDSSPNAGTPTTGDGITGSFSISNSDKNGPDFRGKGMLTYNGTRYLQFDNGEYFIKGGADSPENFLGYVDFDNTVDNGCSGNDLQNGLHRYEAHISDWKNGDPVWKNNKGKGIIGALNYLASKDINSVYFLTMNTRGDGCEVYPWTEYGDDAAERLRYDVSKLDQWNIVLDHMDQLGIMLHIVTQETENDQLLDGGDLGTERMLYYRELVARFGYHLAITWNLGEENTNTYNQRVEFADHLSDLEPYGQHIVIHTYPQDIGDVYDDMLGYPNGEPVRSLTGNSIQRDLRDNIHEQVLKWINRSVEMGHPWVVNLDEIGPAGTGAKPDGSGNNHKTIRQEALWATLMAGGAGVEWYFGYNNPHNDLDMEDWRSRDALWEYTAAAVRFFQDYLPFTEMTSADDLMPGDNDYIFAKSGQVYAVYLLNASDANPIALPQGSYSLIWYNPRTGTMNQGTVASLDGAGPFDLGAPPSETNEDWAALIEVQDLTVRPPDSPSNTAAGLQYAYYEGSWDLLPNFDTLTPITTGVASSIDLSLRQRDNDFSLLFDGYVNAPTEGIYRFFLNSDDGSRLYIGGQLVVDNDGVHAVTEAEGSIALAAGLHALTIVYFEKSGDQELAASWTPPGQNKQTITESDLVYDVDNPLPVELVHFDGILDKEGVSLTWETASELNNAGFEVQRATSERPDFITIGFVEGAGNATSTQQYRFYDDVLPSEANVLSYRLKQIDFDGTIHYSEIIEVNPPVPTQVALNPNYPNPFNPTTTLSFDLPQEGQVRLSIYDAAGRLVETLIDEVRSSGRHTVTFRATSTLASGIYIYQLNTPMRTLEGTMMLLK